MKKIFINIFLVVIFLFLNQELTAQNKSNSPIAAITSIKGKVWLKIGEREKQIAQLGQQLYSGDLIITEKQSDATIVFSNGNQLKLGPVTEVLIQSEQEKKSLFIKLKIAIGKIWIKILKKKEKFDVYTPNAVASVKGTEFMVIVESNLSTILVVVSGKLEFGNEQGKLVVSKLQMSEVINQEAPSSPITITKDRLDLLWEKEEIKEDLKGEIQQNLLEKVINKFGLADSLKGYNLHNFIINDGQKHINEYLSIILEKDLNNIQWKIEQDEEGIVRLKIKFKNDNE